MHVQLLAEAVLSRSTAPLSSVPLRSPGVSSSAASFRAKQAPLHAASEGAAPGATAATKEGSRSTALWSVFITGHDTCLGRTGSTSPGLNGTFVISSPRPPPSPTAAARGSRPMESRRRTTR
ncbi:Os09g0392050, partial [Oryza sativa Japonica Group]